MEATIQNSYNHDCGHEDWWLTVYFIVIATSKILKLNWSLCESRDKYAHNTTMGIDRETLTQKMKRTPEESFT